MHVMHGDGISIFDFVLGVEWYARRLRRVTSV